MLEKHLAVGETYQTNAAKTAEMAWRSGVRLAMILNDAAKVRTRILLSSFGAADSSRRRGSLASDLYTVLVPALGFRHLRPYSILSNDTIRQIQKSRGRAP